MQLLVNTQAQDGFGLFAKAYACSAAVWPVAKLNDAVATLVRRLGVHAVALHEGQASKVIRGKAVLRGNLQDFVVNVLLFVARNKAARHGAVQSLCQHGVLACWLAGLRLLRGHGFVGLQGLRGRGAL